MTKIADIGLVPKCAMNALVCSVALRLFSAVGVLSFVYSVCGAPNALGALMHAPMETELASVELCIRS